jgi:CubicO group peptidase (beta-lactamase class C family)
MTTDPDTVPQIKSTMPWHVAEVHALPGFRLRVRFVDGTRGVDNVYAFIHAADAGVFAHLVDPALFGEVYVQDGAVTWPGELDMAPDAMYDRIKKRTHAEPNR